MTDTELYAAIYDVVDAQMQSAGQSLAADKACVAELAALPPGEADVLALSAEEDNLLFLKKAYLLLLGRPVDAGTLAAWEERAGLAREDFQNRVITGIKASEEFFLSRCVLENDLCADRNAFDSMPVHAASSVTLPERLLQMYRKMPEPMKKAAKKLLGAQ